jgi:hypothetical protein
MTDTVVNHNEIYTTLMNFFMVLSKYVDQRDHVLTDNNNIKNNDNNAAWLREENGDFHHIRIRHRVRLYMECLHSNLIAVGDTLV